MLKINKSLVLYFMGILIFMTLTTDIFLRINKESSQYKKEDYVIIINPNVRADTFLLEKTTGKVWRLTKYVDLEDEPVVWVYVTRLDNDSDILDFVNINKFKE